MVRKAPRRVRIRNPLSGKHRAPQTTHRDDFTITGQRITWLCRVCGEPIREGTGYLEVDEDAATEVAAKRQRFFDAHPHGFGAGGLMALPESVPANGSPVQEGPPPSIGVGTTGGAAPMNSDPLQ